MMNLQDFVEKVLIDINNGVDAARDKTSRDIRFAESQSSRTVEFDIAVSVEDSNSKSGKAGIRVLEFAETGGQLSAEHKNSTVSRITFGLKIDTLTKTEHQEMLAEVRAHNGQLL